MLRRINGGSVRIGIPLEEGILCWHFGRCAEFALVDVDETRQIIRQVQISRAPEHEPGVRPRWLIQNGAKIAIVGGIGERARQTLESAGVRIISGVQPRSPEELAQAFLEGSLVSTPTPCQGSEQLLHRAHKRAFRHGSRQGPGRCHQHRGMP